MFVDGNDRVKAYIFNREGRYTPAIYISSNSEQVASFIVKTKDSPRVVITNTSDDFELDTMDGFIDKCIDQEYLVNELLEVLIPMQQGKTQPSKINILAWGVSEENNKDSIIIPYIKEKIGIDLA